MRRMHLAAIAIALVCLAAAGLNAQTTEFSHQGKLMENGTPATGNYDFAFALFDALGGGTQAGSTVQRLNVAVANGIYLVYLDFGAGGFTGGDRWMEIAVRNAGSGAFTILTPRQRITSAPYAIRSLEAETAITSENFGGPLAGDVTGTQNATVIANSAVSTVKLAYSSVTDAKIVDVAGSKITGTIPVSAVPAGSGNYIQNTTSPQAASNFNIGGTGTATTFNATSQYNLNGSRILSNVGVNNLFAGVGAGQATTSGGGNAFFGPDAGLSNTIGSVNAFFGFNAGLSNTNGNNNAFFGATAGDSNTTGSFNSFFGRGAGSANTTASSNAFFGTSTGASNTTGSENAFFGRSAGQFNTTGSNNAFFGSRVGIANTTGANSAFFGSDAGDSNTTGSSNSFFGAGAGQSNTIGNSNSFLGRFAGDTNTTGTNNTAVGDNSDVSVGGLTFATAIGSNAVVTASNRIQLGRSGTDTVSIGALASASATDLCINGTVLSSCSSSAKYKENITTFNGGLNLVRRLRPVTFDWAERKESDLGLIAEEVAAVNPLLATYNSSGEIEGVKYKQLSVVLINAVKEQQTQIERQKSRAVEHQRQIMALLRSNAEILGRLKAVERRQKIRRRN